MQKYRQKSTVVEAVQFNPDVQPWPDGVISWKGKPQPRDMSWGYIETDDGRAHIHAGDYIVMGASGKPHLCKPQVFEATYEPVEDAQKPLKHVMKRAVIDHHSFPTKEHPLD